MALGDGRTAPGGNPPPMTPGAEHIAQPSAVTLRHQADIRRRSPSELESYMAGQRAALETVKALGLDEACDIIDQAQRLIRESM